MKPGQRIDIPSVPNLRDLGGWPTKDGGRVRRGLLYRSTELNKLQGADMDAFAKLGIRTVYDLRTEAERKAQPDRVPEGTEQIVCDVYADSVDAAPAREKELLSDPKAAEAVLGGGKAETMFEKGYREIVSLPSALDAYHRFFSDLAEEQHRPALFHCTTGKDRTGWAAAATLTFLGVSEDDVMKEYLLTNDDLLPALKPVFDQFAAAGGDPKLLDPVAGVRREYLEAAFDEMRKKFGSFEGYFTEGLRIDAATQQRLRAAFTEGGAAMSDLTAIDILIDPDDSMKEHAKSFNQRMLQSVPPPTGFSLDEHHQPHMTTLQRYVRTAALPQVFAAVQGVLDSVDLSKLTITTAEIKHLASSELDGIGIAYIQMKTEPEVLDFQARLIDAVGPFTESGGTADAYVRTEAEPEISAETIAFIEHYVPAASGDNYFMHVTIGLAKLDDLRTIEAEQLEPFTFSPAGLSVYQLGNNGTAAKQLKSFTL